MFDIVESYYTYGGEPYLLQLLLEGVFTLSSIVMGAIVLSIVLYFFTGDKKKADELFPNLSGIGIRIFLHVWMFITSVIGFIGITIVLDYIFSLLNVGSNASPLTMLIGFILISISALIMIGLVAARRFFIKRTGDAGEISYKLVMIKGSVGFSIISFVTIFLTLINLVQIILNDRATSFNHTILAIGLSSTVWAIFFSRKLITFALNEKK